MTEKSSLNIYCQKNKIPAPEYTSWSSGQSHKLEWYSSVSIIFNSKRHSVKTIVACNSKIAAESQAAALMLEHIRTSCGKNKRSQLGKLYTDITTSNASGHKSLFEKKHKIVTSKSNLNTIRNNDTIWDIDDDNSDDNSDDNKMYNNRAIKLFDPVNDPFNKIYLIDLENKPQLSAQFEDDSLYIGFIGSLHHSVSKYANWHTCNSDNIEHEVLHSNNNKLLYLIDGGTKNLVDHFITSFIYPLIYYTSSKHIKITITIVTGDNAGWCTRSCLEKIVSWRKINNIIVNNKINLC